MITLWPPRPGILRDVFIATDEHEGRVVHVFLAALALLPLTLAQPRVEVVFGARMVAKHSIQTRASAPLALFFLLRCIHKADPCLHSRANQLGIRSPNRGLE